MSNEAAAWQASDTARLGDSSLSVDALFDLLSDAHRRHALAYLLENGGEVSRDELVAHVADEMDGADEKRIATLFYHSHLPKMEDVGLVECDGKTVTATESVREVESALQLGE